MTPMQKEKLIQEEHDARQKSWGGDRKSSGEIHHLTSENPKANKIRKEIAEEHNITENAVRTAVEVGREMNRKKPGGRLILSAFCLPSAGLSIVRLGGLGFLSRFPVAEFTK